MQLSDRAFLCQNRTCAYHQFEQDRDYNASLNILREALHLIGLIDQVVTGIGSDENQAFLKTALKNLRQTNKRLHRRTPGSKNREKARRQVARLHYRVTCMRDDVLHKLTTRLANCYGIIGIEDLNRKWAAQKPTSLSFVF